MGDGTAFVLPCPQGNRFELGKGEVEGAEKFRLVGAVTLLGKNSEQKGVNIQEIRKSCR